MRVLACGVVGECRGSWSDVALKEQLTGTGYEGWGVCGGAALGGQSKGHMGMGLLGSRGVVWLHMQNVTGVATCDVVSWGGGLGESKSTFLPTTI